MKKTILNIVTKLGLGQLNWILILVFAALTGFFMIAGRAIPEKYPYISLPVLGMAFLPALLQMTEAFTKSRPFFKEFWDYEKYGISYSYSVTERVVLFILALLYITGTLILMSYILG